MGVFGTYTGNMGIAEDKKEIFTKQMSKLLNIGGMMGFEEISMYGHKIQLLKPVEILPGESVHFHYNYFEEDAWEDAGFDTDKCKLWSNKIGSNEFNDVIMAGYMLYEAYADSPGLAELNGDIVDDTFYMGWINNVLGTSFSMQNRFHLWDQFEKYAFSQLEWGYEENEIRNVIYDIIPEGYAYVACGVEFADIMYIFEGTTLFDDKKEVLPEGSYPADVYKCRELIRKYYSSEISEKKEKLLELLKKNRESRKKEDNNYLVDIAETSLYMPAKVFLYLATEVDESIEFWHTWKECKSEFYHDEQMRVYVSDEIAQYRKDRQEEPIEPVPTSDFLYQDGYFDFYNTPEEIKDKPNYYISDDDRLYWYDGSDEVQLSKQVDIWLKQLADRHKEIVEKENLDEIMEDFFHYFFTTIVDVDDYYKRIFPFQKMFYEFLENGKQKEYVAAIVLFKELADSEEYRKSGEIIKYVRGSWDLSSRNVTHNEARIKLKRYLSVMSNKILRDKYFGF